MYDDKNYDSYSKQELSFSKFTKWHVEKFRTSNVSNPQAIDYLEFPIFWNRSTPLVEHLYYIYRAYVEEVRLFLQEQSVTNLDHDNEQIDICKDIVDVCNNILKMMRECVDGKLLSAEEFLWLDDKLANFPTIIFERNKTSKDENSGTIVSLYRAREEKDLYEQAQFYHVPFNKLYLCKSSRFCAAGYPCLYLGYSKEVCFAELGGKKGSIVEYKVSEAKCEEKSNRGDGLKILDLTLFNVATGYSQENQNSDYDCNMFSLWPILAACYVAVPREIDETLYVGFREEYVFPQLITKYLAHNKPEGKVHGIRYYCCRKRDLLPYQTTYMNIALFVSRNSDGGDNESRNNIREEGKNIKIEAPYSYYDPYDVKTISSYFEIGMPYNN